MEHVYYRCRGIGQFSNHFSNVKMEPLYNRIHEKTAKFYLKFVENDNFKLVILPLDSQDSNNIFFLNIKI